MTSMPLSPRGNNALAAPAPPPSRGGECFTISPPKKARGGPPAGVAARLQAKAAAAANKGATAPSGAPPPAASCAVPDKENAASLAAAVPQPRAQEQQQQRKQASVESDHPCFTLSPIGGTSRFGNEAGHPSSLPRPAPKPMLVVGSATPATASSAASAALQQALEKTICVTEEEDDRAVPPQPHRSDAQPAGTLAEMTNDQIVNQIFRGDQHMHDRWLCAGVPEQPQAQPQQEKTATVVQPNPDDSAAAAAAKAAAEQQRIQVEAALAQQRQQEEWALWFGNTHSALFGVLLAAWRCMCWLAGSVWRPVRRHLRAGHDPSVPLALLFVAAAIAWMSWDAFRKSTCTGGYFAKNGRLSDGALRWLCAKQLAV